MSPRCWLLTVGMVVSLVCAAASAQIEPSAAVAATWFQPPRNVWTPIGWKDHYFRFNVVYNGTVLVEPCPHWTSPRPNAKAWLGQGLQLDFVPTADGKLPPLPSQFTQLWRTDGGIGSQGWRHDHQTPVLWTEWRLDQGVVLRQEIFSHVKGGGEVQSGIEPHYAWIRVSVHHVDELRVPERVHMSVRLSGIYLTQHGHYSNEDGITIDVQPKLFAYGKTLRSESAADGSVRVMEPDGKVRLIAVGGRTTFSEAAPGGNVYAIDLDLPAKTGEHVDLLVPMLPEPGDQISEEAQLGREKALAESDAYWARKPATAARFHVPEEQITRMVERNLKFAEVIAERDYKSGDYTFLSGSWGYDNLWSTPTSMTSHMFLDLLGYHESVDRHSELFRKHQGSGKPPGPSFDPHPGYLSTPKTLTAFDWISDHGAILQQVSKHALVTDDREFIAKWTGPIVRACDFIKDASARGDHDGVKGLLPPAVATDDLIPTQAVWNLAWHYKGLTTAVRFLKRINHPRAAEFDAFAQQFRRTFVEAYREMSAGAPQWTDAAGVRHPKPPTTLSKGPMPFHIFSDAFYLDAGPMALVYGGLLGADDPLMRSSVEFFRQGPNTKLYGVRSNSLSRPILQHEISSCEPCYSWNILHSWQLGDRQRFLEGMYALFAGAFSPQTYISCEHRHGVYGNTFAMPLAFSAARLAVIDDELEPGTVHLLRLCPAAWISSDDEAVFERMPTEHGTVDLRFKRSADGATLDVSFAGRWHHRPAKVLIHPPPIPGLAHIRINGEDHPATKPIELSRF